MPSRRKPLELNCLREESYLTCSYPPHPVRLRVGSPFLGPCLCTRRPTPDNETLKPLGTPRSYCQMHQSPAFDTWTASRPRRTCIRSRNAQALKAKRMPARATLSALCGCRRELAVVVGWSMCVEAGRRRSSLDTRDHRGWV